MPVNPVIAKVDEQHASYWDSDRCDLANRRYAQRATEKRPLCTSSTRDIEYTQRSPGPVEQFTVFSPTAPL
ncbi:hypothetical protein QLX08_001931 [Tetragonisca angustula]|uniref:Uncharacterized protein n=1 Tax=Tetragonisca angustula TaxID=166442 RepID=A0AAW1AD77_9HYME